MTFNVENHASGNIAFSYVFQGQNISLTLPDRQDPALAGLPRQSAVFKGRHVEMEQALALLQPPAPKNSACTVAVTGLAGTGKTELLLQVAHQALKNEGWFPGGVLFADLHGYDNKRKVSVKRALGTLLRALGIPQQHIPPGIDDRANVYRSALSALSAAGKRVLVVLDDIPPTEKLRYLLPGDMSTATLVSSRHSLTELEALTLILRELPIAEGADLLEEALRTALPEDSRVAAETDAAHRIVALCGGLPLALRILASALTDTPKRPLSHLCRELEENHSRLPLLSREKRTVTAAFELSYRRLSKEQARLFRLISMHPGPDFSTESAAKAYGGEIEETGRLLEDLNRRNLVEPREPYGRWQQHSLVRLYSWDLLISSDDSWGEGIARLLAYYYEMASLACGRLRRPIEPDSAEKSRFPDRSMALEWLESERSSLIAAALWAHSAGDDLMCVALAVPLAYFLREMHYLEDARRVLTAAIQSSRKRKDYHREAGLLSSLGVVLRDMRKLDKSARKHRKSIKICQKLGDRQALAGALNNLGLSLHEQRKFKQALAAHTEAARLFKRAGDRNGAAQALSNAGETLIVLDRMEESLRTLRKAAKIFQNQGDLHSHSQVLGILAKVTRIVGMPEQAIELHKQSLEMPDGLLTPHERAIELSNFGGTLVAAGQLDTALTAQQEALDVFRSLGDRRSEAMTLGNMARVRQQQELWNKAMSLHTHAMELFLESKDDHGLAFELSGLAVTLLRQGHNAEALENLMLAAELYQQTGDAQSAAVALSHADQVRKQNGVAIPATTAWA
ncbi:ATP-binding protein [Streptomyces catenulae]|uniref:Tetratricopeptide repeat protein n=1 Tax=Streptomyces catenulae TaxID=66875 RepID=A0ABV2Z7H6_9ACTN|nr:tetratricopeptide repeat protein [Streptomyces catenulae]